MAANEEDNSSVFKLDDMSQDGDTETWITRLAFGVFGFVIYVLYSVIIASAEDALKETVIPTSVVFVVIFFCMVLITSILPHFIHKIPQTVLLALVFVSMVGGQILYVTVDRVVIRLVGVFVASIGQTCAEVGNVSLSALYSDKAMTWFSCGTGLGVFIGPLYFAGMTTLVCVSPKTTVLITAALPLAYLLFYAIMEKRHYSKELYNPSGDTCEHHLSWNEKLALMWQSLRGVVSFSVGLFVEVLVLGSMVTTLAFQNSPFDPRDHYVYYVLMVTMGAFIGRSYIGILSACNPPCSLAVKKTWILSGVQLILGTFLAFAAWYRFLPNVGLVLVLLLVVGVLSGMLYVNTILAAAQDEDFRSKVFSRGFSLVAIGGGCLMAALLGLLVEPVFREHCLEVSSSHQFCFTRSMMEWNSTDSCVTR